MEKGVGNTAIIETLRVLRGHRGAADVYDPSHPALHR